MSRLAAFLALALALAACAVEDAPASPDDEASDFAPVAGDGKADGSAVFDANNVLADDVLTNDAAMTVEDVQSFLENTPYGASWLATAKVGTVSVAQAVVDAAQADHIHPLVLIARMQVESSGVSKRPGATALSAALGCGCPDGSGCARSQAGLGNQLTCAAHLLRQLYDGSVEQTA